MKVIILAGGKGTRLPRAAANTPKVLVPVGNRPILAYLLDGLMAAGLSDVRLALGFRADQVIEFVRARGYPCEWVVEPEPLGTGGAVRLATQDLSSPFMVLNGDVWVTYDYPAILKAHEPGKALLVAAWREGNRDYGFLEIEGDRVRAFREKPSEPKAGFVSVGCSILEPEQVRAVGERAFMLETDVYPRLAAAGLLKAAFHSGDFEDLGTEERLARIRAGLAAQG